MVRKKKNVHRYVDYCQIIKIIIIKTDDNNNKIFDYFYYIHHF